MQCNCPGCIRYRAAAAAAEKSAQAIRDEQRATQERFAANSKEIAAAIIESGRPKDLTRKLLMTEALLAIENELVRAKQKFPGSNASKFHGLAVLDEEHAELQFAVRHRSLAEARGEAVQVAAMAIRFLMEAE